MKESVRRAIERDIEQSVEESVGPVGTVADGGPAQELSVGQIYRGGPLDALNADEFSDNAVDGQAFDVWDVEVDEDADDSPALHGIDNFPGEVLNHRKVDITGGFTTNIGTAFHFQHASRGEIGLTLVLDTDRIMGQVTPIQYDLEWFDKHPGVLARIETLADGEVRVDGEVMGLVDTQAGSGNRVINKWGRGRMSTRASSPTYSDEAEAVAFTSEVDLDGALYGAVGHYHRESAVGGGLVPTLGETEGYSTMPASFRDERDLSSADDKTLTEWAYEETVERAHLDPSYIRILVTHDRLGTDERRVDRSNFAWLYDGEHFVEDYDDAAPFVGRL